MPSPRPGLVLRPKILQHLNAGLTGKLTLISASTGFGKTTMANEWIRKCGRPAGWLSLDELDNDPRRFLSYFIRALQNIKKGVGEALLESLKTSKLNSFSPERDGSLEALIFEISEIQDAFILVLDDYHVITNPVIQDMLLFLLNNEPEKMHIVISSRIDPPWPLGRWRARGEINELRTSDLRFTLPETAEFLNDKMELELTEKDIAALDARTEGWAAGLQMAAISLHGREDVSAFVSAFAGSHRFVFDYLLEEVLNRQTPEVRQFLLKTSVLERLSVSLCEQVAETGGTARVLLDTLERENLFLVSLDDERGWYRYHQLFADLLKQMLQQTYPGLSVELYRRASHWHEMREMIPEALNYALAAGDMELAARLVSTNVLVLMEFDNLAATLQKLDAVPIHTINTLPWLGIARAWVMGAGQLQKSQQILDTAEKNLESIPDVSERQRLQGYIAAARVNVYGVQGDIDNTLRHAELAEALLPAEDMAARALNLALWGDVLSRDGHDPTAMPILERAMGLALQARKPHVAMIAAMALAMGHLGAGRFRDAYQVCQDTLAIAEEYKQRTQQELSAAAMVYAILSRIFVEWNDVERAIECGFKGVALCERWGQSDNEILCLEYLGQSLMFSGDRRQAQEIFQRAHDSARKISPYMWKMTATFHLDSLLDAEIPDGAGVREQIRVVQESGAEYSAPLQTRLLLRKNQPDQALAVAEKALASLGNQPSQIVVRLQVLRALALQSRGHDKEALAALESALGQAEPENRIMPFVREGKPMEKLLRLARQRSIHSGFVLRLLAAFDVQRKPLPLSKPDVLVEQFSERELEVLRLLSADLAAPDIASKLVISTNTVRSHIKNLYRKLDAHSRHEAILKAKAAKLV